MSKCKGRHSKRRHYIWQAHCRHSRTGHYLPGCCREEGRINKENEEEEEEEKEETEETEEGMGEKRGIPSGESCCHIWEATTESRTSKCPKREGGRNGGMRGRGREVKVQ